MLRAACAIRVILGEDSYLVREGCAQLLASAPQIELEAECGDADSLLREIEERRPDVVLTDIRMPPTHTDEGIRLAAHLRARASGDRRRGAEPVRRSRLRARAARVGIRRPGVPAQGARPRPARSSSRRSRRSPRGESVIDPKIVEVLVAAKARGERSPLAELTPRELEVLAAIAEGKSNAAISESLVLTKRAVEKHINAIFLKLNLSHSPDAEDVSPRVKAALRLPRRATAQPQLREGEARTPEDQGARAIAGLARPYLESPTSPYGR